MDLLAYCRTLKPEDWSKSVNGKWTVKDIVAHLVGWEREVALELPKAWSGKKQPWFMADSNYDDFNATSVNYYKNYSPEELLAEWEKWQKAINVQVERIGEENLRQQPDFGWVFDDGEDGHYGKHYRQIQRAVEGKL